MTFSLHPHNVHCYLLVVCVHRDTLYVRRNSKESKGQLFPTTKASELLLQLLCVQVGMHKILYSLGTLSLYHKISGLFSNACTIVQHQRIDGYIHVHVISQL